MQESGHFYLALTFPQVIVDGEQVERVGIQHQRQFGFQRLPEPLNRLRGLPQTRSNGEATQVI